MGLRHFIRVLDLKKEEVEGLIDRAMEFKRTHNFRGLLSGKILALIFEKASTRTRVSFESAMLRMGGHTLFLSGRDLQLARGEPIKDTARVLSRYVDVVVLRTYSHSTITEFAVYSSVPVINGLSDRFHPCQALSDLMTVLERGKDPFKEKVVWIGDGNNVAQSWIEVSALLGFPLVICCPPGFEPERELLEEVRSKHGAKIEIVHDPGEAVEDAGVINTDVWVSMGQEEETQRRREAFRGFTVTAELLKRAKPDAIVLHCLPAHRGEEITEEVLEGPQSVVWDQSENKMWLHMALLEFLLKGE